MEGWCLSRLDDKGLEEFQMFMDAPLSPADARREPTPEQVEEEGAAFMGLVAMGGNLPGVKASVASG